MRTTWSCVIAGAGTISAEVLGLFEDGAYLYLTSKGQLIHGGKATLFCKKAEKLLKDGVVLKALPTDYAAVVLNPEFLKSEEELNESLPQSSQACCKVNKPGEETKG